MAETQTKEAENQILENEEKYLKTTLEEASIEELVCEVKQKLLMTIDEYDMELDDDSTNSTAANIVKKAKDMLEKIKALDISF